VIRGSVCYPHGTPPALSDADAERGLALLCQARALSDLTLEVRPLDIPDNVRIRRLPCRVERLRRLCHDVTCVHLKLPAFEPFEYMAGQYVDILLPDGRRRSFSIASPPHDSALLELHIRRVPGGAFSVRVADEMVERTLLRIEGPLGQFFLRETSERPILMMAGGTGYAPLKSMIRNAFHTKTDRPIHFYWGVRARRDLYDADRLVGWAAARDGFSFTPVLSDPRPEDNWRGRRGLVHRAVLEDLPDLSGMEVYMAGPPPMIEAARRDFLAAGLPAEHLLFDSFEYARDVPAGDR
jgi:CDP-4-dehydro-6-deoxyglucose reductase